MGGALIDSKKGERLTLAKDPAQVPLGSGWAISARITSGHAEGGKRSSSIGRDSPSVKNHYDAERKILDQNNRPVFC